MPSCSAPRTTTDSIELAMAAGSSLSAEKHAQQLLMCQEVRHDVVGAHANQSFPLPIVDIAAFRLPRSDAHRCTAHQFHFLDFDVPVTKNKDFAALHVSLRQDALDED